MTRSRFFAAAMPIYAILYIIAIMAADHTPKVAGIGAMGFALIAVVGATCFRDCADGQGRDRNRTRNRNRPRDAG